MEETGWHTCCTAWMLEAQMTVTMGECECLVRWRSYQMIISRPVILWSFREMKRKDRNRFLRIWCKVWLWAVAANWTKWSLKWNIKVFRCGGANNQGGKGAVMSFLSLGGLWRQERFLKNFIGIEKPMKPLVELTCHSWRLTVERGRWRGWGWGSCPFSVL